MPDKPVPPRELLLLISRGAVIPFIGAGFSKNADPDYPDAEELANSLSDELGIETGGGENRDPLALGDLYISRSGTLGQLHNTICDVVLPEDDKPGDFHRLFMMLPWRRIFTTNFDSLLDKAGDPRYVPVATNERFLEWRLSHRVMIVKLCGDRDHRTLMRATTERLEAPCLQEEISDLFNDLVRHLEGGTLLYLGYSLHDPFMRSAMEWVLVGAKRHGFKPEQLKHSYMAVFEPPNAETKKWMRQNRIIPLELFRLSTDRQEAMLAFVHKCIEHHNAEAEENTVRMRRLLAQTRRDTVESPEEYEAEKLQWLVDQSSNVLIVTTGGPEANRVLEDTVEGVLTTESLKPRVLDMSALTDPNDIPGDVLSLLTASFVSVFLVDGLSTGLENVAQLALQHRCRAVILCSHTGVLGYRTSHMQHREFHQTDLAEYLREEIFRATVDARLTRSEEYLDKGIRDLSVVEAWIACERAIEHARTRLGLDSKRKRNMLLQIEELLEVFAAYEGAPSPPPMEDIRESRDIRNQVVHDAVVPTEEKARNAVMTTMRLSRLVGWLGGN